MMHIIDLLLQIESLDLSTCRLCQGTRKFTPTGKARNFTVTCPKCSHPNRVQASDNRTPT